MTRIRPSQPVHLLEGKPPLVILHGLLGSARNWKSVEARLSKRFTVFAIDARNHGDSFWADTMSYPEMAADVVRYLDDRGIRSAEFIGHSMGGKTAMETALAYPGRVNRLVVVDIAPRAYPRAHDTILEAMVAVRPEEFRDRQAIEKALSRSIPDPVIRRFLLTSVRREEGGVLRWKVNLQALRDNYDRLIAGLGGGRSFGGRTLFILGGESDTVGSGDEGEILRMFPNTEFVRIDGAHHWVHADRPAEFLSVVEGFLAS